LFYPQPADAPYCDGRGLKIGISIYLKNIYRRASPFSRKLKGGGQRKERVNIGGKEINEARSRKSLAVVLRRLHM
jgi:hypothetical protein